MSPHRRKRVRRDSPDYTTGGEGSSSQPSAPSTLFIQAHEATIMRDRPDIVRALATQDHGGGTGGLIQWQVEGGDSGVWVDRYDARLLLSSLPRPNEQINAPPSSPTGWSDLPSDTEDMFFFISEEMEDIRREKRRKIMDANREERLRALKQSDPDPVHDFEDDRAHWGGDDEEPDEAQRTLMERTAKHLLSSPNPGQLEMRILTNHGSDPRFSFLRGRWPSAWQSIRLIAGAEKNTPERKTVETKANAIMGLVAYGDSDDEDDEDSRKAQLGKEASHKKFVDESEKEARRARAREWSQKRKEGKNVNK